MILSELDLREDHPTYLALQISNNARQYDFMYSAVETALAIRRPFLSSSLIKAFNYLAITCLHPTAGEYRVCPVTVGSHVPVAHWRVATQMEDFVNGANFEWKEIDAVSLAAWALWRLNYIHPFINGNGRTARAVCYFIVCVKSGGLLPGNPILPELLVQHRQRYCDALMAVDASLNTGFDMTPIHSLIAELLAVQLNINPGANAPPPPPAILLPPPVP